MGLWRTLFGEPEPPPAPWIEIPRVFYKYLPVERCHHWLVEQTAGFVALELLNDPYEGAILSDRYKGAGATQIWEDRPVVPYRIGMMTDIGVNPSYDPNARPTRIAMQEQLNCEIEARREQVIEAIKGYRILSLSRTPDNMVMWAHYASNSKGLCIGIDWEKAKLLVSGTSRIKKAPRPRRLDVEYKDHPFESRFESHEYAAINALSRKHTDWAYEREVRMLRHASDFVQYATGTNEGVGLLPVPPDSIVEIILGANPDPRVCNMVRDRSKDFPEARVRQLKINSSGYGSRIHEVQDVSILAPQESQKEVTSSSGKHD